MKPKYYIPIIIIVLIMTAVGIYFYIRTPIGPQPKPALPAGYNWYYNKEWGFKIAHPETWEKEIVIEETRVEYQLLQIAFGENPYDYHAPAIAIIIRSGKCEAELFKDLFPKTTEVIINGKKGLEATIENDAGQKIRMIILGVSDKCYEIICSAAVEKFDEYTEVFDNSINSFSIE